MAQTGADLIRIERQRQISVEEYTPEHDMGHQEQLLQAADCYTQYAILRIRYPFTAPELLGDPTQPISGIPTPWPWAAEYWKPDTSIERNLVKAGALIAAALDAILAEKESRF